MSIHSHQDLDVLPTSVITHAMNSLKNYDKREYIHIEFQTIARGDDTVFLNQVISVSREQARALGAVLTHLARLDDEVSYGKDDIADLLAEVNA